MNLIALALLAGLLAALAALAYAGYRAIQRNEPLRLPAMMQRRGADFPFPMSQNDAQNAAVAARRCAQCSSKELCDELLQSPPPIGAPSFCPNTAYIERLR